MLKGNGDQVLRTIHKKQKKMLGATDSCRYVLIISG